MKLEGWINIIDFSESKVGYDKDPKWRQMFISEELALENFSNIPKEWNWKLAKTIKVCEVE